MENINPQLSIVSPVYKAENIVSELVARIRASVLNITDNFEIILVCDGSPDNSWQEIVRQCAADKRVKGLNLSRNFGQDYAITAGLTEAKGEWMVVMDCDLQDCPEDIPNLYGKAKEDFDIVFGKRKSRHDGFWKRLSSKCFYKLFNYLTDTKQDSDVGNFGIFNRKTINSVLLMKDSVRNFTTMIHWVGFKMAFVPIEHAERYEGKSSYSFSKLMKLSSNIIISFSNKPLILMVRFGFFLSIAAFLVGLYFFIQYVTGVTDVSGFTSLIVSLWFIAGLLILFMGILGLYLGKIFDKTKDRPMYLIDEKINFEAQHE